jgi:hypothetical protein
MARYVPEPSARYLQGASFLVVWLPSCPHLLEPSEIDMEGIPMRFRTMLVLDVLVLLALAVAAWSKPLAVPFDSPRSGSAEAHAVSGKIAAVGDTQFALDILKNRKPGIMLFLIDEHTAIEGQLTIGSQAAVAYRVDGDKMIATHVVITQASGVSAH